MSIFYFLRIQESDGGFFERFGSMLHARNDSDDNFLGKQAILLVDQDATAINKTTDVAEAVVESRMGAIDEDADTGKDSGNESAEADSDSEDKKESMKAIQNAMVGMNVSQVES